MLAILIVGLMAVSVVSAAENTTDNIVVSTESDDVDNPNSALKNNDDDVSVSFSKIAVNDTVSQEEIDGNTGENEDNKIRTNIQFLNAPNEEVGGSEFSKPTIHILQNDDAVLEGVLKTEHGNVLSSKIVSIRFFGESYDLKTDNQGKFHLNLPHIGNIGVYMLSARFGGDETYGGISLIMNVVVETSKVINASVITESSKDNNNPIIDMSGPLFFGCNLLVFVNNFVEYDEEIYFDGENDGHVYIRLSDLNIVNPGEYNIRICYENYDEERFELKSYSLLVTDKKDNFVKDDFNVTFVNIIPSSGYSEPIINITCPKNAQGNIVVEIGGECYSKSITNNKTVLIYPNDFNLNFDGKTRVYRVHVDYQDNKSNLINILNSILYLTWDFKPNLNNKILIEENSKIIDLHYPGGVEGKIAIYIDGKQCFDEIIEQDGIQRIIRLSDLSADLSNGEYNILVKYLGETYEFNIIDDTIHINNYSHYIKAVIGGNNNLYVVNFTSFENLIGTFDIYADGKLEFSKSITSDDYHSGKYNIAVNSYDLKDELDSGPYNIKVTFNNKTITEQEMVLSKVMDITLAKDYVQGQEHVGEYIICITSYNDKLTGTLKIYVDGDLEFTKEITSKSYVDNEYCLEVYGSDFKNGLAYGNRNITVFLNGSLIKKGSIDVSYPFFMSIPNNGNEGHYFELGSNVDIELILPEDSNGKLIVQFNNVDYPVVYNDGVGYLTIQTSDLKIGRHKINARFEGDSKYASKFIDEIIIITPNIEYYSEISSSENLTIKFSASKDFIGDVTIYNAILDENYDYVKGNKIASQPVRNGCAIISLPPKNKGDYGFYIDYMGDSEFISISVKDNNPNFKVIIEPTTIGINGSVNVKFTSPVSSGWVTIFLDDNPFKAINLNGLNEVNEVISNLAIGQHKIRVSFDQSNYQSSLFYTNTFNVEVTNRSIIYPSKIIASNVNTVYNDGKYLVITLKDISGKIISGEKLSIVLNGKTYTKTTDEYGQAKVSTNGLAPIKTYKATITFIGNGKYDKSTTTAKVTVKKANSKLTAKAKAFKKSVKSKNYVVTLKTNQNKVMKNTKLTLKVNGKTYSAKTNAKGQATFKITKLTKKGKFTAVVKFAGNKYYNAKTAKPKITVK